MLYDCYWFITLIMQWWWLAKALKGLILILIIIRNRLCTTYLAGAVERRYGINRYLALVMPFDFTWRALFWCHTRSVFKLNCFDKIVNKRNQPWIFKNLENNNCCWRLARFKFTQKFSAVAKVSGNSISFIHTKCDFRLSCFKLSDEFVFERVLFNFAEVAFP